MEPETQSSKTKRVRRAMRSALIELTLAALFIIAVFMSKEMAHALDGPLRVFAIAPPVFALTAWFAFYVAKVRDLGEFEQMIALRALAISFAFTIWLVAVLGVCTALIGTPTFALSMMAPLAAGVYTVVRVIIALFYR